MPRRLCLTAVLLAFALGACVEQEPDRPSAEDLKIVQQHILKAAPKMKHAVNADLEGNVVYLGLDIDREQVKPGEQFKLTHYWKVAKPVPGWRLFVHLNSPDKKRFVNADHKPIGGRYAVAHWKAGEIIRDEHTITLPRDWKDNKVQVYTGLWKGRLRMKPKGPHDGDNRVLAASIPVQVAQAAVAEPPRKRLLAARATKPIKLDGKLNEEVWTKSQSTGAFLNTMTGGAAPIETTAKVAWDDKHLYVAFENRDEDVWSDLKQRDDKLWTQEAVEVFIDANGDGKDYVELQVNPNGAIFDSYLPAYRRNDNEWNSNMKAAVKVDGTLNKAGDKDKGWTVELAIPWTDTKGKGSYELKLPPEVGQVWRVNLFRLDKPREGTQLAAAWSPPLVGDFHKLDRFGELQFADADGKVPQPQAAAPAAPAPAPPGTAAVAAPAPANPAAGRVVRMAQPVQRSLQGLRARTPVTKTLGDKPPASN